MGRPDALKIYEKTYEFRKRNTEYTDIIPA
jgi:hypothetical protein